MQMHLLILEIFLMGRMGLVGTEMMNIRFQFCGFKLQFTTFYIEGASICLVNNTHG